MHRKLGIHALYMYHFPTSCQGLFYEKFRTAQMELDISKYE